MLPSTAVGQGGEALEDRTSVDRSALETIVLLASFRGRGASWDIWEAPALACGRGVSARDLLSAGC